MTKQTYGLEHFEFTSLRNIYRNLTVEELVEHEFKNGEGKLGPKGAFMVSTGEHTERLPESKFYVDEPTTTDNVWWNSSSGKITSDVFERMQARVLSHLSGIDLYIYDVFCGADKKYRIPIRIVTKKAWHAHFFQNIYILPTDEELESFFPEITILNASDYIEYEYEKMGLKTKEFVLLNLDTKIVLIGGTENSDEIKKGVFSMANYFMALKGILTLHCSANVGKENDVAIFIGAEKTGKTTLSNDPNKRSWHRRLIGDDTHGWSEDGIFNLEGGCYAISHHLNPEDEPDIYQAIRFGAIMENVVYDEKRVVDYSDNSKAEVPRISYTQEFIHNSVIPGVAGHPQNILILANDMYGVLPPVARLTPNQAVYYFLNGYSCHAEIKDGNVEIEPLFSFCFGSAYMSLRPNIYAELLAQKIERYEVTSYLVNTGWTGGPYGVGKRIPLSESRKIIAAILEESFKSSIFEKDPIFGFDVPKQLTGVDTEILNPRDTWASPAEYDDARIKLASLFIDNFEEYSQTGPKTGDVVAVKYLYNEYNKLSSAGPHIS
ncbi:MAG: phosphoenolpyruvate carboxykinase (ATP) [Proteobacteria bacterium]|nr:phosphoenolpyruvate carboxykinase (ATP) [Pseudomonadota bacterium]